MFMFLVISAQVQVVFSTRKLYVTNWILNWTSVDCPNHADISCTDFQAGKNDPVWDRNWKRPTKPAPSRLPLEMRRVLGRKEKNLTEDELRYKRIICWLVLAMNWFSYSSINSIHSWYKLTLSLSVGPISWLICTRKMANLYTPIPAWTHNCNNLSVFIQETIYRHPREDAFSRINQQRLCSFCIAPKYL